MNIIFLYAVCIAFSVCMCSIEWHEMIKLIHINGTLIASTNRIFLIAGSFATKLRCRLIECLDILYFKTEEKNKFKF